MRLYVNIDHVATVRQARLTDEPDPVRAAVLVEVGGADGITVHLREDRRHIQDRDVRVLREVVKTRLNLEMAATEEMVAVALSIRPDTATLVPERREELTTEGGLDVVTHREQIQRTTGLLAKAGITVSLFIDPEEQQIAASKEVGAHAIEFHTGTYANAQGDAVAAELERLHAAAIQAHGLGLTVHAGHGLTLLNVHPIATLPHSDGLNIGHSIISRAIFVGLEKAVADMVDAIR